MPASGSCALASSRALTRADRARRSEVWRPHQRGQHLELSQEPVEGTLFVLGLQAGYGEGGQQQEKQREAGSFGFLGLSRLPVLFAPSLLWSVRRRNHVVVVPPW